MPIEYTSVAIFDAEKVLTGSVTDNEGCFVIKVPVRTEEYLLSVQFVGYTKQEVSIKANRSNVNLGNIVSKKEKAPGTNAVVSASYGFNHFVTGNASVAFNTPKASYRINYSTRYEDDVVNSTLDRLIHESGNQTHLSAT